MFEGDHAVVKNAIPEILERGGGWRLGMYILRRPKLNDGSTHSLSKGHFQVDGLGRGLNLHRIEERSY